jgi:hypothetical protein
MILPFDRLHRILSLAHRYFPKMAGRLCGTIVKNYPPNVAIQLISMISGWDSWVVYISDFFFKTASGLVLIFHMYILYSFPVFLLGLNYFLIIIKTNLFIHTLQCRKNLPFIFPRVIFFSFCFSVFTSQFGIITFFQVMIFIFLSVCVFASQFSIAQFFAS